MNQKLDGDICLDGLELRHVEVLFRHGDRNPEAFPHKFPNDPNMHDSFFPTGPGELTNEGKRRMYEFGKLLRKRYNEFLGPVYQHSLLNARSSNINRTKMSLQLVLAGLYPPSHPEQKWSYDLYWQPIPTNHLQFTDDVLFFAMFSTVFRSEYDKLTQLPKVQEKLKEFDPYMEKLTKLVGSPKPLVYHEILILYHNFYIANKLNRAVDWMREILDEGVLERILYFEYQLCNYNETMMQNNGGTLLRVITDNLTAVRAGTLKEGQKICLYSGHDINIVAVLSALGVFQPQFPEYSSAVIFELFSRSNEYFVKVIHFLGIPPVMRVMQLPECPKLCPLDQFLKVLSNVIASDERMKCKNEIPAFLK